MTAAELAQAKKMIASLRLPLPPRSARGGTRPTRAARRVDLRATLRASLRARRRRRSRCGARSAGDAPPAARRAVRHLRLDEPLLAHVPALPARDHQRPRPRAHLRVRHAAHQHHAPPAAPRRGRRADARGRGGRRTGRAARASARASREFNLRWSRRVLGQNAVRAADHRRPRPRGGRRPRRGDGAAGQVLPQAGLAQPAAALRRASSRGPPACAPCCRTSTCSCRCTISTASIGLGAALSQPGARSRAAAASRRAADVHAL